MKKLLILLALVSSVYSYGQLVANGNSGASTTAYTNGAPNDPIYIWCGNTLNAQQGSLTATPTSGTGPFTFNWFYHDQATSSWQSLSVEAGVSTSTISNLPSDGYRVEIRDASNTLIDCFVAWVWNLNTEVTASSSLSNCNNASLSSTVNTTGSFSYYNPPPPQSLINSNTQIQVCFTANHTFVSDLAFYLVGPPACGSPTILLLPNPGAIGQGSTCNSGDNVNNLCFTTSGGGNINVCNPSPSSLSGTYSTYGPSNTPINWSSLIGCNAAGGGWAVQIYDCIGADVGALTNANITFSNLTSICGSPTTISYSSGAINSVINDNSCTAASASIFQVPVSPTLTTPITITATTTLLWAGPGAIADPTTGTTTSTGLPAGTSTFTLTATTTYGTTTCSPPAASTSVTVVYPTVDAGPDQTVCMGQSVTLSGSGAQTYTWNNGVTNGVPFVPGATTTYTVTGTAANGCTDTDDVLVTVNTTIPVGAGQDQSVCMGQPVTLSGSGAQTYTWNNGVTNGVPFVPASTATYTVTGTDANGCTGTDQVVVTVNPLPVVDAGPAQNVCQGTSVTLNGSGAQTYTWNNGVTNGVPFIANATTTYTVTGTNANGCTNTDQVTITINPAPTVNAGADQAVCQGAGVTLTATGAQSYSWNNGVTNGVSFVPGSTATYTVTGTAANGCTGTDQVIITVNPIPVVNGGANQTICEGSPFILSGSGAQTYTWNNGVTNGAPFTPPLGTNTYVVTGTTAAGCQSTDTVVITVILVPTAVLGSNSVLSGYPGLEVEFTNSSLNSNSYNFAYGNGSSYNTTNILATPSVTYQTPGTYTVILTASNGVCQDTAHLEVIVIPFPPMSIVAPNIFTPNGDGKNDIFFIRLENATAIDVTIVNRWGNKMVSFSGLNSYWDGTVNGNLADEGVYFYNYTATGLDGTTQTGQGNVQLIK
ncbi:gliding motility-associated C-terminal domain-containing protein [Fluviicola sp.]|uniref:gliding motility-associated C-terminal domain-containing protein n=1 Tax=Fluviicola sp. TaxID=1917219 RepID=UPI0031DEEE45